jgi:DNA invertase Pin-like site-specific DNA recombinase
MKYISYLRVSTAKQSNLNHEGFGIKAQRQSVEQFISQHRNDELVDEYIEVESGTNKNRLVLGEAMKKCKDFNCTLLIARLDRLARSVSFISALMESGVKFKCIDMPEADNFTIHIIAAVAERERQNISNNSKRTWAMIKKHGTKDGKPIKFKKRSIAEYKRISYIAYQEHCYGEWSSPAIRMTVELISTLLKQNMKCKAIAVVLNKGNYDIPMLNYPGRNRVPWNQDYVRRFYNRLVSAKFKKALIDREERLRLAILKAEAIELVDGNVEKPAPKYRTVFNEIADTAVRIKF